MSGKMAEQCKAEFCKMIEEYKKSCIELLDQSKTEMNDVEKAVNGNFDQMLEMARKSSVGIKEQLVKGSQGIVDKFKGNSQTIQKGLQDAFGSLSKENMPAFASNLSKFTEQLNTTINAAPMLKSLGIDAEVTKYLTQKSKQTLETAQKKCDDTIKLLKDNTEDTAAKFKLTLDSLKSKK